MSSLAETARVGDLVTERPRRSRVFEEFGIDYCCGGQRTLAVACLERGVDPDVVMAALRSSDAEPPSAQEPTAFWPSLTELIDDIVATHHASLRTELPRLAELFMKTEQAHGERHRELAECRQVFGNLRAELESHMRKEEQILFPAIRGLESSPAGGATSVGSVHGPIRVMEKEHDSAGDALLQLRKLTGDYTLPEDACNTWRSLLDGLKAFELDLHQHIHKENNILFPNALELEEVQARNINSVQRWE
jgi:regulator of cell morphogenesis and NO signaling